MAIALQVHLEATDDPEAPFVWWAETDEVPGFTAAASHLSELLERSKAALTEILEEEVEVEPTMVPVDDPVFTPVVNVSGGLANEVGGGQRTIQVSPPLKTRVPA